MEPVLHPLPSRPLDPQTDEPIRPADIFKPLQVRDDALRASGLNAVLERLRKYEAAIACEGGHTQAHAHGVHAHAPAAHQRALMYLMPTMVRLASDCPYEDVRAAFTSYLQHLRDAHNLTTTPPLPPSAFIPLSKMVPLIGDDSTRRTFEWSFVTYGRVSSLSHAVAFHAQYLDCLLKTFTVVSHDEGPLPLTWRTYIAIMACARHDNLYMLRRQQDMYLLHGGDPEWLYGVQHPSVPAKLAALAELNAILAHRPWLLRGAHIKGLTSGGAGSWSLNELVHAIVVMCFFHSLCSLCQPLGVCREADNGIMLGVAPVRAIDASSAEYRESKEERALDVTTSASIYNSSDVAAREAELQSRLLAMQGSAAFDLTTLPQLIEPLPASIHAAPPATPTSARAAGLAASDAAGVARSASQEEDEDEEGGGGWDLGGVRSPVYESNAGDDGASAINARAVHGEGDGDDDARIDTGDDDELDDDDGLDDEAFEEAGAGAYMDISSRPAIVDGGMVDDSALPPSSVYCGSGHLTGIDEISEEEARRREKRRQKDLRRRGVSAAKSSRVPTADSLERPVDGQLDETPGPPDTHAASAAATEEPHAIDISTLRYKDFETSDGMFVTHDFCWEDHAYSLLQRFYPAAAPVLDKQFRLTFELTYHTFGSGAREIDTEPFRTAIWYYIQRLYGVCNDHYDYQLVNRLMTRETKGFAKKVACYPETMTREEFNTFTTTFTPDEKVHIVMLAAEARRQAELLYGLRAVMRHMSGQ